MLRMFFARCCVRKQNINSSSRVVKSPWPPQCDVGVAKNLEIWQGYSDNRGNTGAGAARDALDRVHQKATKPERPRNLGPAISPLSTTCRHFP